MKKVLIICVTIITVLSIIALCGCGNKITNSVSDGGKYENANQYSIGNFTYNAQDINSVEINWCFGDVTIVQSTDATLSVSESGTDLTENQKLRYWVQNRTLIIQFWKSEYTDNLDSSKKNLTVQIPANINLDVETVSGKILADTLDVLDFDAETVSGNIEINSLKSAIEVETNSVSGNINLGNVETVAVNLETVSGAVNTFLKACRSVEAETVSGNVSITLGTLGANVAFETVSGKYNGSGYTIGNRAVTIEVETVSGNLTIQ